MATSAQFGAASQVWNFPKLKGQQNYYPWAKKMRVALSYNDMWERVSTQEVPPLIVDNATQEQQQLYQATMVEWRRYNAQAMALIHSMCEEKPGDKITECLTAYDSWGVLQKSYTSSGYVYRYSKLEDIWDLRCDDSMETYVADIRSKAKELQEVGYPVPEWILVSILLHNLDSKYKDVVYRLLTSTQQDLLLDQVVPVLHEEERLLKRETKAHAMTVASKGKNNRNDGRSKDPKSPNYKAEGETPECDLCEPTKSGKKKRHWPLDCWERHPEKTPERFKKPRANAANEQDDFEDANSTHISAMAHSISREEDCVGDHSLATKSTPICDRCQVREKHSNECWNLTPKSDRIWMREEFSQRKTKEVETELGTWLNSRPNLSGEMSQAPSEKPGTSESSENSEKITKRACMANKRSATSQDWLIDSGCTNHMFFDREEFKDYQPYRAGISIADGTTVWTKGRGTIKLDWLLADGTSNVVSMKDIYHVPDLTCGLFSISQATRQGLEVTFKNNECHILQGSKLVGIAPKVNNSYILNISQLRARLATLISQNMKALSTSLVFNEEAVELWHRRMGHLNEADLKKLVNISKGIVLTHKPRVRPICEACNKAKSVRKVSRRVQHEVLEKLSKIHVDLGGPINVPSINGAKYYMLLTDQATLRTWCYTFKHKDETYNLFRQWKTEVEAQSGYKVKIVRFDNGGEFINDKLKEHFKDAGIIWEPTVPYTPEQNGLSEVQNRIIINGVRAMLFDSKLTRYLWSELLHTKVYQKNRSPTSRLMERTPHEAWTGEQPYLGHMRIIGCVAWVHIPKEKRKKLDERSKKCYLIGYEGSNIFKVWNPASRRVERTSHVDFDESRMMTEAVTDTGYWLAEATGDDVNNVFDTGDKDTEQQHTHEHVAVTPDVPNMPNMDTIRDILTQSNPTGDSGEVREPQQEEVEEELPDSPESHPDPSPDATYTRKSQRIPRPSQKSSLNNKWEDSQMWAQRAIAHTKCDKTLESERMYCRLATLKHEDPGYHDFEPEFDLAAACEQISQMRSYQATQESNDDEPLTYEQAMASPFAKQWKEAMDKQMGSFETMKTWKLTPRPENEPVLTGKWVFKIKKKLDGSILYKARWVVRGFEQIHRVNYDQTFASVVKSMSFKVLFAIIAHYDLDCEQMDVVTAFLNALLREVIYVEQPTGYGEANLVCLLQRALYGLKQAPREWYHTLRDFLISKGFKTTESDHSLFVNETTRLIVSVYVDDIQIYGPKGSNQIAALKKELNKRFAITDLGPSSYYLGMEIQRDRHAKTVRVTQITYLKKVLARFNMANCAPAPTPMVLGTQLQEELVDQARPDVVKEYQSMVGSIMYPMIQTRPDICFAVTILSRYNHNPNSKHIAAVKRVIRYLKGTLDYGITYGSTNDLVGYTDADWASDVESRRSLGAYVFMLYGGPISWSSKRQQSIALSSCEAEYMAQTQAAKEAIWMARLLSELDIGLGLPTKPVQIKADNQGAIALTKDPRFHSRTKHIDIQWHFVRDQVETGAVQFTWVPTNEMVADGLTKALSNDKFRAFVRQIGLNK